MTMWQIITHVTEHGESVFRVTNGEITISAGNAQGAAMLIEFLTKYCSE